MPNKTKSHAHGSRLNGEARNHRGERDQEDDFVSRGVPTYYQSDSEDDDADENEYNLFEEEPKIDDFTVFDSDDHEMRGQTPLREQVRGGREEYEDEDYPGPEGQNGAL